MILPVLQRELLVRARTGFTYLLRTATAVIGLVAVVFLWGVLDLASPSNALLGQEIFTALLFLLVAVALFEGVRSSALSIVEERTEGTLGLLFLTDLSSRDILVGKVGSHALSSLFALLGAAPLLMLPLLLGGVDVTTSLAGVWVVLNALLFSLACGTLASVWCRKKITAFALAYGLVIVLALLPMLVRLLSPRFYNSVPQSLAKIALLGNPIIGVDFITRWSGRAGWQAEFWLAQAAVTLVSLGALAFASRLLKQTWLTGKDLVATAPKTPRRNIDDLLNALGQRFSSLSRWVPPPADPLSRILAARLNVNRWLPLLMLLAVAQAFAMGVYEATEDAGWGGVLTVLLISLVAQLLFCHIAVQTFAEGRGTGELEILLTTPLDDRHLVNGLWFLLRRFIGWIAGISVAAEMIVALGQALWGDPYRFLTGDGFQLNFIGKILTVGADTFALCATAWFGLWAGLRSRNSAVAVAKTFGWTTLLPGVLITAATWGLWLRLDPAAFGSGWTNPWSEFIASGVTNLCFCLYSLGFLLHARSSLFQRLRTTIGQAK